MSATTAFGYSLSGGMDIDNNTYPDLTVGELGLGRVTSFRGRPLVTVTAMVKDIIDIVNITGDTDRLCPQDAIMLHW